jgi:hypothetical protein
LAPAHAERLDEGELADWREGRDAGLWARRADDWRGDRGPPTHRGERLFPTDYVSDSFMRNITRSTVGWAALKLPFRPNPRQPCLRIRRSRRLRPRRPRRPGGSSTRNPPGFGCAHGWDRGIWRVVRGSGSTGATTSSLLAGHPDGAEANVKRTVLGQALIGDDFRARAWPIFAIFAPHPDVRFPPTQPLLMILRTTSVGHEDKFRKDCP